MIRVRRQKTRAQSMVEFALVVPLFLLLMLGLIDFARLLFTFVSLSNATREMARVAAVSTNWSNGSAIDAFNNYALFASGRSASTDSVTVTTGTATCARTRDTGGTCTTGLTTNSACPLTSTPTASQPLATCTFSKPPSSGFVEIQTTYVFQFNPLFQNKVEGVIDVWFMRPTATITTTARAYVE